MLFRGAPRRLPWNVEVPCFHLVALLRLRRDRRRDSESRKLESACGNYGKGIDMGKSRVLIGVVLLVGVVAWLVVADRKPSQAEVSVRGEIVHLDAAARTGSIEYTSPETGEAVEVSARIAEKATISLNGRPATLGDLLPGDSVAVTARIKRQRDESGKSREITVLSIAAERAGGGNTSP